jgi:hypothetical protein
VRVSVVTRRNHVWRIEVASGAYFVKTWTKDWYDWADTLTTGALNADHEAAAFELLAAHGLAVPGVVVAEPDFDLFRLVLLTTGASWWAMVAPHSCDAARRDLVLRHLLASGTWDELLDVSALSRGDGRP